MSSFFNFFKILFVSWYHLMKGHAIETQTKNLEYPNRWVKIFCSCGRIIHEEIFQDGLENYEI